MKLYVNSHGYAIEKKVLNNSGIYSDILLGYCDELINNKGNKLSYTILKKLKNGSLIEFLSLVKNLPLEPAKFFLKLIVEQLKKVHETV